MRIMALSLVSLLKGACAVGRVLRARPWGRCEMWGYGDVLQLCLGRALRVWTEDKGNSQTGDMGNSWEEDMGRVV